MVTKIPLPDSEFFRVKIRKIIRESVIMLAQYVILLLRPARIMTMQHGC